MKLRIFDLDRNVPAYSGIYFILDNDEIIYVGKSRLLSQRITIHRVIKRFALHNCTHVQFVYIHEDDLVEIEKKLIVFFTPKLNKAGSPKFLHPNKGQKYKRHGSLFSFNINKISYW